MNKFSRIACALATSGLVAAAGCGAGGDASQDTGPSSSDQAGSEASPRSMKESGDACPLSLPGITSSVEDTVDGVIVLFETPKPGDAAELRRRVERLADVENSLPGTARDMSHASPPQAPGPRSGGVGATTGGKLGATASVEPSESGFRLVLRPKDPSGLDATRDRLRKHADELVQGACKQVGRTDH